MSVDIFGNEIHVGDECAFIAPHCRELNSGVVVKVTPRGARVEFKSREGHIETVPRRSNQIACKR